MPLSTPELLSVAPPAGWIRRVLHLVLRRRGVFLVALSAALVSMGVTALVPLGLRAVIDTLDAGSRNVGPLVIGLLALGVLRMGAAYTRRYSAGKIASQVELDLRTLMFDHLQRLDFARHDEMQTGQLVSRANTDVNQVRGVLAGLPMQSSNVLLGVISLGVMLVLSPLLTAVALFVLPAVLTVALRMRRLVYASSWDAQQKAAEVAGIVEEAVTGVRVVKGFGQEDRELGRLISVASTLLGSRMRNIRITSRFAPALQSVPALGQVAILAFGGWLVINDRITLGTFLAFSAYLVQLVSPVRSVASFVVQAQNARAGAERIFELLDSTPVVVQAPSAYELPAIDGAISFEDVSFGYMRSEPVLRDFSLEVAPGETVALVGGSGSGKSTTALLLPRFYDVQQGAVRIDGHDVRDLTLDSMRRQVGVVFEDSFLFSESVHANIAYGRPDATVGEVTAAARAAGADKFIAALPDGYDTVVGERGYTLSGGQRQRIALARALLTNPRVLILDDATSSIDAKTEAEIHQTLRQLMPGRTTILIAHRRSTLDLADRIVVVDKGGVLDSGTHAELLRRCPLYADLLTGPDDDEAITIDTIHERGLSETAWPDGIEAEIANAAIGMATPADVQARIDALPAVVDAPRIDLVEQLQPQPDFGFRKLVRPYRRRVLGGLALIVLDSVATLAGPYIIKVGIDTGVERGLTVPVWIASAVFFAIVVAGWAVAWSTLVYTGRTAEEMLFGLRARIFAHLQRLGIDFYEREMAGRVMTRMTSDIDAFQMLFQQGIINAVISLVSFFGAAGVLLVMNARLAAVALLVAVPLSLATAWFRRRSERAYLAVRDRVAAVNANFQESLSGVRVAQAYVREQRNIGDFRDVAGEHYEARLESIWISSVYFPFVEMLALVAQALVLFVGAGQLGRGDLTTGELIAFVLYLTSVFAPIQQLSQVFDTYQQAGAALVKIRELLAAPVSTPVADHPVAPPAVGGDIRFERVVFRYPVARDDALRGVDLHIPSGRSVALVGETGSGKSTIVKLIARFYDPTAGRVLVDGVPLSELDLGSYRRRLGFVPQEAFLFTGTIRDNIAYGRPDATDEEVEWAARAVGAHDFIALLPNGYRQWVTERGRSLSAGQRQLIALARARLVDPVILLLDEATSNLDLATEARVNKAMRTVSEGRTTIVIAHRLQTARRCDTIVVVDNGRIAESGSHEELLAAGGAYANLWNTFAVAV